MKAKNVTPEPGPLIEAWSERQEDRLYRKAVQSARRWGAVIVGLNDAEFIGLEAAIAKERERRSNL